ncbi:uncharacterized protein F4822DRAFT_186923 [Hypoxylon trugodes]|uniref:uncharacterized protein n=1 Tax=Hypoxylon trugodes TaxID=326681 RepID=UPI00219878F8|nr:uncharacterized protein F4822DRAFT_186923 [Hypoxylon trugodes]KAI1391471.1 hypothetical protein F4822DRAFT_186923 [Hypoxylon trugodes]
MNMKPGAHLLGIGAAVGAPPRSHPINTKDQTDNETAYNDTVSGTDTEPISHSPDTSVTSYETAYGDAAIGTLPKPHLTNTMDQTDNEANDTADNMDIDSTAHLPEVNLAVYDDAVIGTLLQPDPKSIKDETDNEETYKDTANGIDTESSAHSPEISGLPKVKVDSIVQSQVVDNSNPPEARIPTIGLSTEEKEKDESECGESESSITHSHHEITRIFPPGKRLVQRIIARCRGFLSAPRVSTYCGFRSVSPQYTGNSSPIPHFKESRTGKRKYGEVFPDDSTQGQVHGNDGEESRPVVGRRRNKRQARTRNFACAFNVFDDWKYSGSFSLRYASCGNNGFDTISHYKQHIRRIHILHQCSRCEEIFRQQGDLETHLLEDPRCEEKQFIRKDGLSQTEWEAVKKAFEHPDDRYDDEKRWFRVWDVLFPGVTRPPDPYYRDCRLSSRDRVIDYMKNHRAEHSIGNDDNVMRMVISALNNAMPSAPPIELDAGSFNASPMQAPTANNDTNSAQRNNPSAGVPSISDSTEGTTTHTYTSLLGPGTVVSSTSFPSRQPVSSNTDISNTTSDVYQRNDPNANPYNMYDTSTGAWPMPAAVTEFVEMQDYQDHEESTEERCRHARLSGPRSDDSAMSQFDQQSDYVTMSQVYLSGGLPTSVQFNEEVDTDSQRDSIFNLDDTNNEDQHTDS